MSYCLTSGVEFFTAVDAQSGEDDHRESASAGVRSASDEATGRAGAPFGAPDGLGPIDIQRSQIMAAARNAKPMKCMVRRS